MSVDVDEEVAALAADVTRQLVERRATWRGNRLLTPADVGVVDPHVASEAAVRRHLRRHSLSTDEVMVGTPEIWQGLERPIMVVKHPLSGQSRLDAFALEPGRMCVMLSRHLLGCIVVGRDGIGQALEGHHHDRQFIFDEHYRTAFREWKDEDKPSLGFIVAGYSSHEAMAEEYQIDIIHGECSEPRLLRKKEDSGIVVASSPCGYSEAGHRQ